jgi:hypothetical protein
MECGVNTGGRAPGLIPSTINPTTSHRTVGDLSPVRPASIPGLPMRLPRIFRQRSPQCTAAWGPRISGTLRAPREPVFTGRTYPPSCFTATGTPQCIRAMATRLSPNAQRPKPEGNRCYLQRAATFPRRVWSGGKSRMGMLIRAPLTTVRADIRSWNIGWCMTPVMPGRAAVPQALTPIPWGLTPRRRCSAFSWTIHKEKCSKSS